MGVGSGGLEIEKGLVLIFESGPNIEKFKRLALENKSHPDL